MTRIEFERFVLNKMRAIHTAMQDVENTGNYCSMSIVGDHMAMNCDPEVDGHPHAFYDNQKADFCQVAPLIYISLEEDKNA